MYKSDSEERICYFSDNETITFAANELSKYINLIDSSFTIRAVQLENKHEKEFICIGLFEDFGINTAANNIQDDAIYIDMKNGNGIIAGSNPRSVLLAIYRYLHEIGCRWIRPGVDGEYIPCKDISKITVSVNENAAYKHRGICIEGAVSFENVSDIIKWMPKVGFNEYFIQFQVPFTFFDRWYSHLFNPYKKGNPITVEQVDNYVKNLEVEIIKRGISYHAVGHGWTCEALGIPGMHFDEDDSQVKQELKQYLALVDGKRELWGKKPLYTNLCYSNPKVRVLIVDSIIQYLQKHKNINVLHFWLSDGSNNHCECDACTLRPADYFIQMLNELDEALNCINNDTKIVFIIYQDTMWPPVQERFNSHERFILMFAPITRIYSENLSSDYDINTYPEYIRNKIKMPKSVGANIAFLKGWKKVFYGDSIDFDYHLMWYHYSDPGGFNVADIINKDIKNLKHIGLNGLLSCQVQRAFYPTGFPMYVMGQTLWNDNINIDQLADDYFTAAFGNDGKLCKEFLLKLSILSHPEYISGDNKVLVSEIVNDFKKLPKIIKDFSKVVKRNKNQDNICFKKSWQHLDVHVGLCSLLASYLIENAIHNKEISMKIRNSIMEYLWAHEDEIQDVFDVYEFICAAKYGKTIFGQ